MNTNSVVRTCNGIDDESCIDEKTNWKSATCCCSPIVIGCNSNGTEVPARDKQFSTYNHATQQTPQRDVGCLRTCRQRSVIVRPALRFRQFLVSFDGARKLIVCDDEPSVRRARNGLIHHQRQRRCRRTCCCVVAVAAIFHISKLGVRFNVDVDDRRHAAKVNRGRFRRRRL
jgi:hypothetical protein